MRKSERRVLEVGVGQQGAATTEPGFEWRVVHTKSRQEKALAEFLDSRQIRYFLPLVRTVKYYGRRKFTVSTPLFQGYLFLRGTIEDAYLAERTDRVVRVIPVSDQAALESDIHALGMALERGAPLRGRDWVADGDWVEVASGPFKGLRGIVERGIREDRLVLRVRMLGRAADLEIDRSLLVLLDR
jgi:transcription antitermination factor NusG